MHHPDGRIPPALGVSAVTTLGARELRNNTAGGQADDDVWLVSSSGVSVNRDAVGPEKVKEAKMETDYCVAKESFISSKPRFASKGPDGSAKYKPVH